jgi:hypothetical protein
MITYVRSGSTKVQLLGPEQYLTAIYKTLQQSKQVLHQFTQATALQEMAWTIDGRRYELKVST